MQCGRLDQLRLKYKETAAGFTHPVSTHFTNGKFYSNVLLLSLVLSCTSLWPIMVIDPSRPPICSSSTHCQHLNSEMCRHRVYKKMSLLPSSAQKRNQNIQDTATAILRWALGAGVCTVTIRQYTVLYWAPAHTLAGPKAERGQLSIILFLYDQITYQNQTDQRNGTLNMQQH